MTTTSNQEPLQVAKDALQRIALNICGDTAAQVIAGEAMDAITALQASATNNEPLGGEKCQRCDGEGAIGTGIEEAPTMLCAKCNGTGFIAFRQQAGAAGAGANSELSARLMAAVNNVAAQAGSDAADLVDFLTKQGGILKALMSWTRPAFSEEEAEELRAYGIDTSKLVKIGELPAPTDAGAAGASDIPRDEHGKPLFVYMGKPCRSAAEVMEHVEAARISGAAGASESIDTPEFWQILREWAFAEERATEEQIRAIPAFIHAWRDAQLARQRQNITLSTGHTYTAEEIERRLREVDAENAAIHSMHDKGAKRLEAVEAELFEARQRHGGYLGWFLECTNGRGEKIFAAVNEGMPHAVQLYTTHAPQAQGEPVAKLPERMKYNQQHSAPFVDGFNVCLERCQLALLAAPAAQADEVRDAARYRWLRQQHWNEAALCVVATPKDAVKPGYDCPSMDRLDTIIDTALRTTAADNQKGGEA